MMSWHYRSDIEWWAAHPQRRARVRPLASDERLVIPTTCPFDRSFLEQHAFVLVQFAGPVVASVTPILPMKSDRGLIHVNEIGDELTNEVIQRSTRLSEWCVSIDCEDDDERNDGPHGAQTSDLVASLTDAANEIRRSNALFTALAFLAMQEGVSADTIKSIAKAHGLDVEVQR